MSSSAISFHNELIAKHGVDKATGFSDKGQRTRFAAIVEEIRRPCSVLDYGCGPGDFYFYAHGACQMAYTGVDVNEHFVEHLVRRPGFKGAAVVGNALAAPILGSYDYVIASGVFCHVDWLGANQLMQALLALAKKKLIVNFLRAGIAKPPLPLRAYYPSELLGLLTTTAFKIRADYLSNDMMLVLSKE